MTTEYTVGNFIENHTGIRKTYHHYQYGLFNWNGQEALNPLEPGYKIGMVQAQWVDSQARMFLFLNDKDEDVANEIARQVSRSLADIKFPISVSEQKAGEYLQGRVIGFTVNDISSLADIEDIIAPGLANDFLRHFPRYSKKIEALHIALENGGRIQLDQGFLSGDINDSVLEGYPIAGVTSRDVRIGNRKTKGLLIEVDTHFPDWLTGCAVILEKLLQNGVVKADCAYLDSNTLLIASTAESSPLERNIIANPVRAAEILTSRYVDGDQRADYNLMSPDTFKRICEAAKAMTRK